MATVHKHSPSAVAEALRSPSLPVLLTVCALVIGLAALVPLIQSSDATSTNAKIQQLEQERSDWQARVHELELDVAYLGSLDRIENEAKGRLKMVAPQEVHYLTVDVPAPAERRLPSRFLPPQPQKKESGSSLWDRLFGWLPSP